MKIRKQIEVKLDALKRLDKGKNVNQIAMDIGVRRTIILDWKKKRTDIELRSMKTVCTDSLKERKRHEGGEYEKVSEAFFLWFRHQRK